MIRVKICGITNIEDALFAYNAGADYLGFIFASFSKRYITADKASQIASVVKGIPFVGVFVNESVSSINEIVSKVPLSFVQIHGEISDDDAAKIKAEVIRTIRIKDSSSLEEASSYKNASYLLYDTFVESYGGEGKSFDRSILSSFKSPKPFFLAGGLNACNVSLAIEETSPFAVDVSSGVEKSPGIKDHAKIESFIKAVGASCIS